MADEAKVIEKYKGLVAKMTGDAALVDKYIAGEIDDEAILTPISNTFWETHKNKPERVGALLNNARTEEAIKHKKAFLKALDLPESEFESFKEISDVFKKGKETLEAKLKNGAAEKNDTEAQIKVKLYETELEEVRKRVKYLEEVEIPLADKRAEEKIANFERMQWFFQYANKFETTLEEGFAKKAAIKEIYGEIFGKYGLYEHTDGTYYLTDKKTGERISTGQLTYLKLDDHLVAKLREAKMFKESNAKDNRNTPPGGSGGNPPTGGNPPISDAQAEKIRKAKENLERMQGKK